MSTSILDEGRIAARFNAADADRADRGEREDQKVIGPRELYALLRRRFVLIGAIVVLGTSAALVASFQLPKTYTARSTILLEPDDPNLLDDTATTTQAPQPGKAAMDTQTDLITSRAFMTRVVKTLGLVDDPRFNPYLPQTQGLAAPLGSPQPVSAQQPASDPATLPTPPQADASGQPAQPDPAGATDAPGAPPSRDVQLDRAISSLLSRIAVSRSGESMAMTVTASAPDPTLAASIANAVTNLFVEWSRDQKRATMREAVDFLRQQAGELASNIAATERQIADYSRDNNISSDPRDDLLRAAMGQANEQLSTARGELTQAQARLEQVRAQASGGGTPNSDPLLASDFLTSLRNDEASAMRDRAQLARNFGANHPLIQEADAKIASVRSMIGDEMGRILANLENDVRVAQGRVDQLEKELVASNGNLRQRGLAEIRLRELNRDLLTEQKLYDVVSGRLGKLDPYANVADPGARVISVAETPVEPSFPKPRILAAGGLAGSLVLGFLAAMTMESLDTRVRTARRASQILRAPALAQITELPRKPWQRRPNTLDTLFERPRSAFAEGFRSVRNACRRSNAGRGEQIVMVTSSLPTEGKTTTAAGLAIASATAGVRTVLVDLDLRASSLHAALRLEGDAGSIEHYLEGDCTLVDILQPVAGVPNLDVATSASHGRDDAGVPDASRLAEFFAALRRDYDMVVIDAPPLLVVDDAASLASLVDAVVLVVGWGRITEDALTEAGDRLRLVEAPLVGVVLNRVDPSVRGDSAYRASRTYKRHFRRYFTA